MIEVLFQDSEAGAMKSAVRRNKQLGGEVICLGLLLDIGNLNTPLDGEYRKGLYKMMFCERWGKELIPTKREIDGCAEFYLKQLERVKTAAALKEPMRVWYSSCPYSICGFLHFCSILTPDCDNVYAVELPTNSISENTVISRVSWSEAEPRDFTAFLTNQRILKPIEIQKFTMDWNKLVKENSQLRAMINGNITSVPVSFYDFLIRRYLGDEPVTEAVLIGTIMGENPLGVSDWFYAARIQHFIRTGLINIVKNAKQSYKRVLRLNYSSYVDRA